MTIEGTSHAPRADVRLVLVVVAFVLAACSDTDPPYGAPGAIKGKEVAGIVATQFFTGPYNATENAPTTTASNAHASSPAAPKLSPDLVCLTCHRSEGGGGATAAAFAGFVRAKSADAPAAAADVVVFTNGQRLATKTGPDGYFWIAATAGKLGPDAHVAVRDAQSRTGEMSQSLPNGACTNATCHGTMNAAGLVVVPE